LNPKNTKINFLFVFLFLFFYPQEKKELTIMRTKKFWERRFHSVESGANNVLFIRTSLPHPEALVEHIVAATAAGGGQSARYILRLVPILGTCKAALRIRRHFGADPDPRIRTSD
jgi:hypothetical protein